MIKKKVKRIRMKRKRMKRIRLKRVKRKRLKLIERIIKPKAVKITIPQTRL